MPAPHFASSNSTGFGITTLLAIGGILIVLDQFRFAEAVFGLAALWALIWLWFRPYRPRFEAVVHSVILCVLCGLIYFTEVYWMKRILDADHGWLSPANDWTLPSDCGPRFVGFKQLWMGKAMWVIKSFPQTVISISQRKLLSIDFKEGKLSLSAEIFGPDGRIIAAIENNEFDLNRLNYFRKRNPDLNTIIVDDQYNNEVMNLRFFNQNAFRIKGIFQYMGHKIKIDDESISGDGLYNASMKCVSSNRVGCILCITD